MWIKKPKRAHFSFLLCTLIDIGGLLVPSVLKSNQIAQHVVSDVGNKAKQNGTAGRLWKLKIILKINENINHVVSMT